MLRDLSRKGNVHVVTDGGGTGLRSIDGFPRKVASIQWLDSGECARFTQSDDHRILTLDCTGYDYGTDMVVRIAEIHTT